MAMKVEESRSATKIVATIGPASEERIGELIDAGMSVARINFSHGSVEDHRRRVAAIRAAAREPRRGHRHPGRHPGAQAAPGPLPDGRAQAAPERDLPADRRGRELRGGRDPLRLRRLHREPAPGGPRLPGRRGRRAGGRGARAGGGRRARAPRGHDRRPQGRAPARLGPVVRGADRGRTGPRSPWRASWASTCSGSPSSRAPRRSTASATWRRSSSWWPRSSASRRSTTWTRSSRRPTA